MKKNIFFKTVIVIALLFLVTSLWAQDASEKVKKEITEALTIWNNAAKSADLDKSMTLFDDSDNIMLVGSANGEINKGKAEVRAWLTQIFGFAGFSWEMTRVDIDTSGKTAWVFMDGKMIVNFHKGGTKITPYRFTGIMIKKNGVWKWRLFNGSVPEKE